MKKTTFILAALLSAACISAQETLTLEQCREMALKYNKEMAAAARQTESAHATPQRAIRATSSPTSASAVRVSTVHQTAASA